MLIRVHMNLTTMGDDIKDCGCVIVRVNGTVDEYEARALALCIVDRSGHDPDDYCNVWSEVVDKSARKSIEVVSGRGHALVMNPIGTRVNF